MKRRKGVKNPAVFAIISFVSIIGVSFMLVFSAVASSNSAAIPERSVEAEVTEAAVTEAAVPETTVKVAAQPETTAAAKPEARKSVKTPVAEEEIPAAVEEEPVVEEPVVEEEPAYEPEFELLEAEEEPAGDLVAFITEDQVNFRSAPDSDVVYVLYYGSTHEVIGTDGDWTHIYVDGFGDGYVYTNYVSLQDGGDVSSYASIVAAAEGAAAAGNNDLGRDEYEDTDDDEYYYEEEDTGYEYAFINDDGINFRSSPEAGADNVICMLNYGTTGYYYDSYDGWIYMYVDGYGEGYASSSYVTLTNDGEIATYAASSGSGEDYEEEEYVDPVMALRWEVANYACSFAGWLPYVWGSHSLTYGADCSGFTSAVYAQFGYSLSCDSEVQSRQGYSVPLSEILPGDIIVYSGHVAMYVGDGLKVHAPYPGTVVTIDSAYYTTILDVRRIID